MNGRRDVNFNEFNRRGVPSPVEVLEAVREDHDRLERMIEEIRERVNGHGEDT